MPNPIAVLVEDDPEQMAVSRAVLLEAGFEVREFTAIESVLDYLSSPPPLLDLFVLDRRLPMREGEPEREELGDELLAQVRSDFRDARIVVFTGYASIRHVQEALRGSGQLPVRDSAGIDRVSVLEKSQSLEFRAYVQEYRRLLQELDDIEVTLVGAGEFTALDRRLLRRVGYAHQAVAVNAQRLAGGLTGASVWKCELRHAAGSVGRVVVKQVESPEAMGGLAQLLPRSAATATVGSLSGLMGGRHVNVIQLAGDSAASLMSVLSDDAVAAAEQLRLVQAAFRSVPEEVRHLTVAEIAAPLLDWSLVGELLGRHGIEVPPGSMHVTVRVGMRHGDLHPANILVDEGRPVLIDYDSSCFGAGLLDPVAALLSTLVHPESPIKGGGWPPVEVIRADFGTPSFGADHPQAAWFAAATEWLESARTSDRELWAVVLSYAARQLKYDDVSSDPPTLERVLEISRLAAQRLQEA